MLVERIMYILKYTSAKINKATFRMDKIKQYRKW